jgi:hypothetical protein
VPLKSAQEQSGSVEDVEELLDTVDKNLERVKTLYEQYFLGIQKQAPTFLHTDIERKLRDLTQLQVRNTGLRYRLATVQQKFGAYNSYWKRTLRQIENGTYFRNLSKIGREAIRTGAAIPEEILAAMPKRMREQVLRDRDAAIAIAKRRKPITGEQSRPEMVPPDADELAAMISEPTSLRRELKTRSGAYVLDESDAGLDLESFFAEVDSKPVDVPRVAAPAMPALRPPAPMHLRPPAPINRDRDAVPTPIGQQPSRPVPAPPFGKPPPIPPKKQPTGAYPAVGQPPPASPRAPTAPHGVPQQATGELPVVKITGQYPAVGGTTTPAAPAAPTPPKAPSQITRPNPIVPGSAAARGAVPVQNMSGPFAKPPAPAERAAAKPAPSPPSRPPPGMTDADVNALYAKYVQAKQMVGEAAGPREREKLLRTINAQAPKIMEQYKAKGVDFTVVVKDNQVIIRAKPKP